MHGAIDVQGHARIRYGMLRDRSKKWIGEARSNDDGRSRGKRIATRQCQIISIHQLLLATRGSIARRDLWRATLRVRSGTS
jgi:hypothetical protein